MDTGHKPQSVDAEMVEQFMAHIRATNAGSICTRSRCCPTPWTPKTFCKRRIWFSWRKFDRYQQGTNFFAWACRIIRYEVLKHHEKRSRTAGLLDPDVLDRLAEVAVAEVEHLDEQHRRSLIDCMSKLSQGDRELMRQRYAEAMAVKKMAEAMNRSPNAVSQSLGRIRRLLLDCIEQSVKEKRGLSPFAGTARRVLGTNGDCPHFSDDTEGGHE